MLFGTLATCGWASGLNLYLCALLLGLARHFEALPVPEWMGDHRFLIAAGVLFLIDFFVDKITWLDAAWTTAHTVIRPVGASVLGAALSRASGQPAVFGGVTSGGLSLTSALPKLATRYALGLLPEPVTNVAVSLGEDVTVVGLFVLLIVVPVVVVCVVGCAGLVGMVVGALALRWFLRRRDRREAAAAYRPPHPHPGQRW